MWFTEIVKEEDVYAKQIGRKWEQKKINGAERYLEEWKRD